MSSELETAEQSKRPHAKPSPQVVGDQANTVKLLQEELLRQMHELEAQAQSAMSPEVTFKDLCVRRGGPFAEHADVLWHVVNGNLPEDGKVPIKCEEIEALLAEWEASLVAAEAKKPAIEAIRSISHAFSALVQRALTDNWNTIAKILGWNYGPRFLQLFERQESTMLFHHGDKKLFDQMHQAIAEDDWLVSKRHQAAADANLNSRISLETPAEERERHINELAYCFARCLAKEWYRWDDDKPFQEFLEVKSRFIKSALAVGSGEEKFDHQFDELNLKSYIDCLVAFLKTAEAGKCDEQLLRTLNTFANVSVPQAIKDMLTAICKKCGDQNGELATLLTDKPAKGKLFFKEEKGQFDSLPNELRNNYNGGGLDEYREEARDYLLDKCAFVEVHSNSHLKFVAGWESYHDYWDSYAGWRGQGEYILKTIPPHYYRCTDRRPLREILADVPVVKGLLDPNCGCEVETSFSYDMERITVGVLLDLATGRRKDYVKRHFDFNGYNGSIQHLLPRDWKVPADQLIFKKK